MFEGFPGLTESVPAEAGGQLSKAMGKNLRDLWIGIAVTSVFLSGCAGPRHAVPPPSAAFPTQPLITPGSVLTHIVQPKETLWSIGKRYGVSYTEIMRANSLTDPTQVPAGQALIIPRAAILTVPRIPLYPATQWDYIVIHHSDTQKGDAKLLDRIHRKRGFSNGLGYHFVIDNGTLGRSDGEIQIGHRWRRQMEGAHCDAANMNYRGIGICLVGDFTGHRPSDAQMESLVSLVEQLRAYYNIPMDHILRHKDVPGKHTACPGDLFPWVKLQERLIRGQRNS